MVIIGVPICESKAYVWDKLKQNLFDIQANYPGACRIVFAVSMLDGMTCLFRSKLLQAGDIVGYTPVIPDGKAGWLYNIAAARNALRDLAIQSKADYLYMADCDMTCEPLTLWKMLHAIQGYDVANSAYRVRQTGSWGFGSSPALYTREILQRFKWHCAWWDDNRFIAEDEMLDFDLFLLGAKINRGAFITNTHWLDTETGHTLQTPMVIPPFRKLTNSLWFRFIIVGISRLAHYDVALVLHHLTNRRADGKRVGQ